MDAVVEDPCAITIPIPSGVVAADTAVDMEGVALTAVLVIPRAVVKTLVERCGADKRRIDPLASTRTTTVVVDKDQADLRQVLRTVVMAVKAVNVVNQITVAMEVAMINANNPTEAEMLAITTTAGKIMHHTAATVAMQATEETATGRIRTADTAEEVTQTRTEGEARATNLTVARRHEVLETREQQLLCRTEAEGGDEGGLISCIIYPCISKWSCPPRTMVLVGWLICACVHTTSSVTIVNPFPAQTVTKLAGTSRFFCPNFRDCLNPTTQ